MKNENKLFSELVRTDTYRLTTLMDELIRTSFFLPPDVLEWGLTDWEIQPIKLCTHDEWIRAQQWMLDYGAVIKYENGSKMLVMAAHTVAVSIRRHYGLNEWIVIAKPWYGDVTVGCELQTTKSMPPVRSPNGISKSTYKKI